MRTELAIQLVLCGVLLAGLTILAQHFQPDLPRLTFHAGLAGGGLCVLYGTLSRWGKVGRGGAMVTLTLLVCVLARQALLSWGRGAGQDDSKTRIVMILTTVSMAFCLLTLAKLLQAEDKP